MVLVLFTGSALLYSVVLVLFTGSALHEILRMLHECYMQQARGYMYAATYSMVLVLFTGSVLLYSMVLVWQCGFIHHHFSTLNGVGLNMP